ncbi:MAG: N-acetylmuramoyl-L-alanine amidase [Candidatus Obscuribacter sp.]|nr:N-acetylmuramoyl-L-alanine amidase [Candidatus Obscuribacter sp.]
MRPIVILDAGHGGKDSGAVVGGTKEKDLTRALNDLVTKKLQDRGVFVEHTNPTDKYISPTERRERADRERGAIAGRKPEQECQADAAVSIHANHDGVNNKGGGSTRGLEILLNGGKGKDGTLDLAKSIQGAVNKEKEAGLDVVDGGLRNRPGLAFTKAQSPTVLVEAGYMTNNRDLANLKDPVYREKLATAITNGIAQFLQNRPANCRK